MAKGGWIFNPGEAEDSDLVTCFYCGKNLDGWEQGDDPTYVIVSLLYRMEVYLPL